MNKLQSSSVKKIPTQRELLGSRTRASTSMGSLRSQHARRAIQRITHHRVMNRREMHSYLVRPAGLNLDIEQGKPAEWGLQLLSDAPV